jgi:hypothetical protein
MAWDNRKHFLPPRKQLAILPLFLQEQFFLRELRFWHRHYARLMGHWRCEWLMRRRPHEQLMGHRPPSGKERRRIEESLSECHLFQPATDIVPIEVEIAPNATFLGCWRACRGKKCHVNGWQAGLHQLKVRVRPDWSEKVYENKLAVIEGHFVLDIATSEDIIYYEASKFVSQESPGKQWLRSGLDPANTYALIADSHMCCAVPKIVQM